MIEVTCSDITSQSVDAIVNAANERLAGGGGVDGAIHRAAGPELLQACRRLGGCPAGEARITPGFRLPAKWVIHAVGPVWRGGLEHEDALLVSCYQSAFRLAVEASCRSIALPCISTGAFGFPKARAAVLALRTMRDNDPSFERIIACCFSEGDAQIYRGLLAGA